MDYGQGELTKAQVDQLSDEERYWMENRRQNLMRLAWREDPGDTEGLGPEKSLSTRFLGPDGQQTKEGLAEVAAVVIEEVKVSREKVLSDGVLSGCTDEHIRALSPCTEIDFKNCANHPDKDGALDIFTMEPLKFEHGLVLGPSGNCYHSRDLLQIHGPCLDPVNRKAIPRAGVPQYVMDDFETLPDYKSFAEDRHPYPSDHVRRYFSPSPPIPLGGDKEARVTKWLSRSPSLNMFHSQIIVLPTDMESAPEPVIVERRRGRPRRNAAALIEPATAPIEGGKKKLSKRKANSKRNSVTKKKMGKIHRGPRGGKYYIRNGRKIYI